MGIFDFLSPPAAQIPLPQMQSYNPGGMGQADQSALGGIGNLGGFNLYGQGMPQAQQFTQNLINNPYAGNFMSGAVQAGGMGQQGAQNAFGAGGGLMGMGGMIGNTAFDPQNQLYQRTVQQLQDQTRAGQAARGISTTPYGAGLEDQSMRNFNIDWQNQQLQRQIAGGQAAGGLIGQGAGMQAQAPGQYLGASAMPYGAFQGIGQGQMGALGQLGQFGQQAGAQAQQPISDYLSYLGWGSGQMGANNAAQMGQFNAALAQDKQAWGQQGDMFGGLGKVAGGLWGTSMPGGGSLGGNALSMMFSDERVKEDIAPVGELYDRTPVYSYRYKGDPTPRIGLMAQDVEQRRPDAVTEIGGVKAVDYDKATEWSRGLAALSAWG